MSLEFHGKLIQPRPNSNLEELLPEGRKDLEDMKVIIDELYARNLYVILDFHQDIANEVYGGDGFLIGPLRLMKSMKSGSYQA